MATLIQAIIEAEACDTDRAAEILTGLDFEPSQFGDKVAAHKLSGATVIHNPEWGFVVAGHTGEPGHSESLGDLLPPGILPETYAEAAYKLGIYRPDGFSDEDRPWTIQSAQYAAAKRADDGGHGAPEATEEYGHDWESGKTLVFADGSVFYADGGRHEVWRNSSDFESEYGDFRNA